MFEISYTLTLDDYRNTTPIFEQRVRDQGLLRWASRSKRRLTAATASCIVLTLAALILGGQYDWIDESTALYSIIAFLIGTVAGNLLFFLFATGSHIDLVRQNGPLSGFTHLTAADSGISVQRHLIRMQYEWSAIEAASSNQDYIVLWLETSLLELIPHRAFSTAQERSAFHDFVMGRLSDRSAIGA